MSKNYYEPKAQNVIYIYYLTKSVSEGGMARNNAFYEAFNNLNFRLLNVHTKYSIGRLWMTLKAVWILATARNKTIFIHQGTLFFIFSMFLLRKNSFREKIFSFLNKVARYNKLIIEINDLVYEQAIDLELEVDEVFKILQDLMFTIPECNYVFASNEMKCYVNSKYFLDSSKSSVVLNGAPKVQDYSDTIKNKKWIDSNKVKYVYAGSLNKGRQIEELLDIFKTNENCLLIILGSDGEWINNILLPQNILYLGNYQEKEAHYIVSKCDIGIIPYNSDRFYYNMCYPTKASFYLAAGLPILSTKLKEMQNIFENKGVFLFSDFKNWSQLIEELDYNTLKNMQNKVNLVKEEFYWEKLLNDYKYNNIL
ncbi:glycosyltransferase [Flavobacterium sp. ARAG 55.4]|uniref:glycosyltransferase n=1 Tax=Flavobacterium sp. ARAG 55.4 TaxID=3451357 RepID=UPI003F456E53